MHSTTNRTRREAHLAARYKLAGFRYQKTCSSLCSCLWVLVDGVSNNNNCLFSCFALFSSVDIQYWCSVNTKIVTATIRYIKIGAESSLEGATSIPFTSASHLKSVNLTDQVVFGDERGDAHHLRDATGYCGKQFIERCCPMDESKTKHSSTCTLSILTSLTHYGSLAIRWSFRFQSTMIKGRKHQMRCMILGKKVKSESNKKVRRKIIM